MKKLLLMLSLLIVAMFLVGCGTGEAFKFTKKDTPVIKQICAAGPTGNWDCVKNEFGTYLYTKEMRKTDCTKYYSINSSDKIYCENSQNNPEYCKEDVGCCLKGSWNSPDVISSCNKDNTAEVKMLKNICTDKMESGPERKCSSVYHVGPNKNTCVTKNGLGYCRELCKPGEEIINCYFGKPNNKYICNSDGIGYKNIGLVNSCPTGTTCKDTDESGSGNCK